MGTNNLAKVSDLALFGVFIFKELKHLKHAMKTCVKEHVYFVTEAWIVYVILVFSFHLMGIPVFLLKVCTSTKPLFSHNCLV